MFPFCEKSLFIVFLIIELIYAINSGGNFEFNQNTITAFNNNDVYILKLSRKFPYATCWHFSCH